jgi:hypothetical protein
MSPSGSSRRCVSPVAIAILVAAVACGDPYVRTNPYDNVVPVAVTIQGPDTLYSFREQGQYTATSDPSFPDSSFQYASSDSFALLPAAHGTFTSLAPPLYPAVRTATVIAGVGAYDTEPPLAGAVSGPAPHVTEYRHVAYKVVVMTQLVTNISLRCPDTHGCDTVSAGGTWSVWVDGKDANGHNIVALTSSVANPTTGAVVATFATHDTTIATVVPVGIRASTVTAKKTGTTWIVATRGTLLDSLQLVVK